MLKSAISYTVIINTLGRSKTLVQRSVQSALSQSLPPEKVILVDQNMEPLKLSIKGNSFTEFIVLQLKVNSVSVARNHASKFVNSEWIVFCDDDGYLTKNYSQNLQARVKRNKELEIIAGSILIENTTTFYSPRHAFGGDMQSFLKTKLLMGSNFATKRNTFLNLNGFDEDFGVGSTWGSGEETDFSWNAHFKNVPSMYDKSISIYHIKPYSAGLNHSIRKAYNYGVGKGALVCKWLFFKKHPVVFYELFEMIIIPIIKFLKGLLSFNYGDSLIAISSLLGRLHGVIAYCLKR